MEPWLSHNDSSVEPNTTASVPSQGAEKHTGSEGWKNIVFLPQTFSLDYDKWKIYQSIKISTK